MITASFIKLMFKRFLLTSTIASFLLIAGLSLAQEKAATSSSNTDATGSADVKKIKDLKDKLATQVAAIRENQKRGFYGEIAALSKTSFTLVTASGEVKVRYSDDTLIYKLGKSRTEAKNTDLKNGLTATVLGLYDEETKQQTAKVILIQSLIQFITGDITAVDKTAATITIATNKGETVIADYEKTTDASELDSNKKLTKSGISRLSPGDRIHVWGIPNEEDNKKLTINRLLRIPKDILGAKTEDAKMGASASPTPKASVKSSPLVSPQSSPKSSSSPQS